MNLDIGSTAECLQILQACDLQIFGDKHWGGLGGEEFQAVLSSFWKNLCKQRHIPIVLAGAGTSGRLCRLVEMEAGWLNPSSSRRILATLPGGAQRLQAAKALGEDELVEGKLALQRLANLGVAEGVISIGVTCGLSAKYVEGFIASARAAKPAMPSCILGFNPAEAAVIELFRNEIEPRTYLLNPIIGPEAVTGSVRMKGGSATLMILFSLLSASEPADLQRSITRYRNTIESLPKVDGFLASVIDAGAASLRTSGRIFLLGEGTLGALCVFDAAECVPTFSAPVGLCEGFVDGGWAVMLGSDDAKDNPSAWEDTVSWNAFLTLRLPGLTDRDTVLLVCKDAQTPRVQAMLRAVQSKVSVFLLCLDQRDSLAHVEHSASLSGWGIKDHLCQLIALRCALGRISTCIFAHSGALYQNLMIDHRITNRKLLRRAVGLVNSLGPSDEAKALEAIAQVVRGSPRASVPSTEEQRDELILAAAHKRRIVPQAIWHLRHPELLLEEVAETIEAEPVLRRHSDDSDANQR